MKVALENARSRALREARGPATQRQLPRANAWTPTEARSASRLPPTGASIAEFPHEVRAVLDPPSTTASLALEIDPISVASVADASEIAATVDTLLANVITRSAPARGSRSAAAIARAT
jgi:hypothetical protein